ncbi:MAG: CARDB domain-containing protein [Candidatus Aenigmatarchaeota archaeon]
MKKALLIFLILLVLLVFKEIAFSLDCKIVYGSCPVSKKCIFSIKSLQNSHAGACDYYSYNICCDQIYSYFNQTCNISTSPILSFYQMNDSHVAKGDYYNLKLCAGYLLYPIDCEIRDNCYEDEICLISLYNQVNSHVAECNYYHNKLCCKQLSDLVINSSSFEYEYKPLIGSTTRINITVFNDGDANAYNVNVSCYENGALFDSKIINVSKKSYSETYCDWEVSCSDVVVKVDPLNEIKELNETNNEFTLSIPITEILNVSILYPLNNSSFYRGEEIWLNSSVTSSCNLDPPHETYWYFENSLIGIGDSIKLQIPTDDSVLGIKNITAFSNSSGYISSSSSIFINILNNPPKILQVSTNVSQVESEEGIEITCSVYDLEDCEFSNNCNLNVNISVLDANNNWNNFTANKIGNTFYIDYTAPYYPLGEYKAYCIVWDSENDYAINYTNFIVWQRAVITINLNSSYYFWNSGVKVYGRVFRTDKSYVQLSSLDVYIDDKKVCSNIIDIYGYYECEFLSPSQIGNYILYVNVTDELTGKTFSNQTLLVVKFVYGGDEKEMRSAETVSCYEVPQLVVNPDGSIKKVYVRVCVWK